MTAGEKWDRRYRQGDYVPRQRPSPFLVEWLERIPPGRALDVACGAGRNALAIAESGFAVDAIDASGVAIDMARQEAIRRQVEINWQVVDVTDYTPTPAAYRLITVFRFRQTDLWERLAGGLAPDGWILIETHLRTHLPVDGPASPEFRLQHQELLDALASLRIVHYSETLAESHGPKGQEVVARIAACNGDPGW